MASATYDSVPFPLQRSGATIVTVRYSPSASSGFFTPLPNVVCVDVSQREGHEPSTARFRYQFDQYSDPTYPRRIEDVTGFDKSGPYVVANDDRLCVLMMNADGGYSILFDGFAQVPQSDLSAEVEQVTFQAIGVEIREWDTPIEGAIFRNGPDPSAVLDTTTELPCRFNPNGKPNASPSGADSGSDPQKYPVFLDAELVRTPDVRQYWTVAMAAKFLMVAGNPLDTYTKKTAKFATLDTLLAASTPTAGQAFDPANPANATTTPITVQDLDVQGDPWPVAMANLLTPYGLDFRFSLSQDKNGKPQTSIVFFRIDDADKVKPKTLNLPVSGTTLEPGSANLSGLSLTRDSASIANRIVLDTQLVRYEVGVVLAPGFTPDPADLANETHFDEADKVNFVGENVTKYRDYVYSEAGDGYWSWLSNAFVENATELDTVFGKPVVDPVTGKPDAEYAKRRRKPSSTLFSTDPLGNKLPAELWMSSDYTGLAPDVWDGTGTWMKVSPDTWKGLPDRLGVRFISPSVWNLNVGAVKTLSASLPGKGSGKIDLICSMNATVPPTANTTPSQTMNPRVYFLYFTTIEGDNTPGIVADRRVASESQFEITRRIDTRDRFYQHYIHKSSYHNTTGKTFITPDSNYLSATAFADGVRSAHENSKMAGTAKIPRISLAYSVGDKIAAINGRGIDLRSNAGAESGEAAMYPVVVGVTWTFDGTQSTTLTLSDRRAEPAVWHGQGHDLHAQ